VRETLPKEVATIVEFLSKSCPKPDLAVVLGSGVSALDQLHNARSYMYDEVFGIAPTVAGHTGSVTIGQVGSETGAPVAMVFRGRFEVY
jgi:purine nucleoside phosphorylase